MSSSVESEWKDLYRIGGIAPLLTLVFYISELSLISWDSYPASTRDWFLLIQQNKLLGLFYLNVLDIFSISFLGIMFLALHAALTKTNKSLMVIAAFFALLGVGVFIVPRIDMLSLLPLSDRFASAITEAERATLLSAGEALGSLGTPTPQTIGFLFMSIGVLLISFVMLQSNTFNKITAWFGILASMLTFATQLSMIIAPSLSTPLMFASGLFWFPWWAMVGLGLLRLAGNKADDGITK